MWQSWGRKLVALEREVAKWMAGMVEEEERRGSASFTEACFWHGWLPSHWWCNFTACLQVAGGVRSSTAIRAVLVKVWLWFTVALQAQLRGSRYHKACYWNCHSSHSLRADWPVHFLSAIMEGKTNKLWWWGSRGWQGGAWCIMDNGRRECAGKGCNHMFSCGSAGLGPVVSGSHLKLSRKPHWKNPEQFFLHQAIKRIYWW